MKVYNGNYPIIAYYVPDDENQQSRIPFRCRKVSEGAQFFTESLSGLVDTGTSLSIVTPKHLKYQKAAKVIIDGILYSVTRIDPFIPDQANRGPFKTKNDANYLIQLT